MYLVRRIYEVHPGQARKAATLVDKIGKAYEAAGSRSPSRVYFNSGTTPGTKNRVVMEWTDASLETPYREDRIRVDVSEWGAELSEISVGSEIEFWELMTEEKHLG
ncbi:MAG: hypothetical protein KDB69_05495 [Acidimicrobiia bacterium]|nr:hypothetical protein [Acidimicrobiia bacterium]